MRIRGLAPLPVVFVLIGCSFEKYEASDGTGDGVEDTTLTDTTSDSPWDVPSDSSPPDSSSDPGGDPAADTTPVDSGADVPVDTGVECSLVPNAGCPSGKKCTISPAGRICETAGPRPAGSSCIADAECAAGTYCGELHSDEGAVDRMCLSFCAGEGDCPGDASVCYAFYSWTTETLCSTGCDLVTSVGCPPGTKCLLYSQETSGQWLTHCIADSGTGTAGSGCDAESLCAPGHFCGDPSGVPFCIPYCTLSPTDSCSCGCQQFIDTGGLSVPIIFDGVSYGYCYC